MLNWSAELLGRVFRNRLTDRVSEIAWSEASDPTHRIYSIKRRPRINAALESKNINKRRPRIDAAPMMRRLLQ